MRRIPSIGLTRQTRLVRGGATLSTLLDNLVAYYPLDESSGTRADALGSYDLTAFNSPTSGAGIQGNAAEFASASSQYLEGTITANRNGKSWFASVWVKVAASPSGGQNFLSTANPTNGKGIDIAINSSKALNWRLWTGGTFYNANFDASLTNNTWHHVVVAYNATTSELVTWLDAANKKTTASIATIQSETTVTVSLGYRPAFGGQEYFDGLVDEVGIWLNKYPTDDEIAELYNAGVGIAYPFA